MLKIYQVVLLELLTSEDAFRRRMKALGADPAALDRLLSAEPPLVMKRNMSLGYARRYAEAVREAGGRVLIREDGTAKEVSRGKGPAKIPPLERFTMCPQCGLKQIKGRTCERCGHPL
ncbi:MAG: hypothetical protein ACLFUP_09320 [Desulfobacteraceae bacterium]